MIDRQTAAVAPPSPAPIAVELRLLTGPVLGSRFRWVRDLNGHPGRCGEDCWHPTPEAALDCFRGER